MDESLKIPETKQSDIKFIVTGVCLVLFGAIIGSLYTAYYYTQRISEVSTDTENTEGLKQEQALQVGGNDASDSISEKEDIPLEELVEPVQTLSGSVFVLEDDETKAIMQYPESIKIYKVGFLNTDTVNYGVQELDQSRGVTYKIRTQINEVPFEADISLTKLESWKSRYEAYEVYGNKFYTHGSTDGSYTPRIEGYTKDGLEIFDFSDGDVGYGIAVYSVYHRKIDSLYNGSSKVTISYEIDPELNADVEGASKEILIEVLRSVHFEESV